MKITREALKAIVKETMIEESEYQEFFKRALEKAGKSIPQMSDDEKKAFFNKIEKTWKGRGAKKEEVSELTDAQKKLPPALQKAIEKKDDKKKDESVNEGVSTEEKRIAMLAVRKQAKYRNVSLESAIQDQINALMELKRDAKRGKIK
tara:strand:- start:190 stop:633 length:444 start_codon:yes stop_codon:yes gene_type:complete